MAKFPIRYLGIPLAPSKVSVEQFAPFIYSMRCYLQRWNHKTLSYTGKVELIGSVIQGVEAFWLQAFPMPVTILDAVSSMCLKFLWGGKNSKVKWDDVCAPKEEGGLGIKNIKVWNKALLFRTLWNIHSNAETLWFRWVHSFYLKGTSIFDFIPKHGDSYLIKEIVKIRNDLVVAFGGRDRAIVGLSRFVVGNKFLSGKVYDVLRVARVKKPWMSCVWKHFIPPKHSFTVWLACRGRNN
ncbi:reverse transcriptase [Lithospermum erythrorhizon]|uniref:Reverse transcriptase n=1 Tax=Lithospermum erythrorhizon TaxID=34254 RepID=A0AAV3QR12_LITER